MSDPLRTDVSRTLDSTADSEREATIERLLLGGLDHYFAGEYEQAIDVWSRAFFLDRTQARARAYIERARSALAERQRESEELLQSGLAAFQRGDGSEARRLLVAAMTRGASSDEALAALDRLNRLEQGARLPLSAARGAEEHARPTTPPALSPRAKVALALAAAVVAALVGVAELRWSPPMGAGGAVASPTSSGSPSAAGLPLPRRGETALNRARDLVAGGRLRDALRELDSVRTTDPQRPVADRLKADIQRQLIAIAAVPPPSREGRARLP
jgi:tetratricopeptide (TPR) repeat protein